MTSYGIFLTPTGLGQVSVSTFRIDQVSKDMRCKSRFLTYIHQIRFTAVVKAASWHIFQILSDVAPLMLMCAVCDL